MLCLEVTLNGKPYCLAGLGDEGAISAFVTWARFLPVYEGEENLPVPSGSTLLNVTGFTKDTTAVHWGEAIKHLKVNDEVTIRVVEADKPDEFIVTQMLPEMDEGAGDESE